MPNARSTEVDPLGVINLIGSNLIDRYSPRSILKELLQNADDAGARTVVVGWTPGPGGNPAHQLLHDPALFVVNDGKFTDEDARAICQFGQNYKYGEKALIGKFGLGLKSVFHLCEAFFYLSSMRPGHANDDGHFNNLASPWVHTEYHRGWNTVKEEDLNLLREFLQPICSPLGDDWFALWLPLRQKAYCETVRFSARYDGELSGCPPELLDGLTERGIARVLPLLHSVKTIRFWQRWGVGVRYLLKSSAVYRRCSVAVCRSAGTGQRKPGEPFALWERVSCCCPLPSIQKPTPARRPSQRKMRSPC